MKKVLVSGYIGFNNFGDEAIFYALSTHLKTLGCVVSVLCNNKHLVKKQYDVKTYNYKKPLQILKAIFSCDCLISGGGSLLQNKTSNFSLIYYLLIIFFAKICFKKVFIFSQGIEKINGKFFEFITRYILKICDFVSVRDENSYNLLKSWKIDSILTSDPVYSLVQDVDSNIQKEGLIVQLRAFDGINEQFLNYLAEQIAKNYNGKIQVLSLQDSQDKEICEKFVSILKTKNIDSDLLENNSIEQVINYINCAKYVISTRLHGLIVASALCPNVFGIIYDDKIATLAQEFKFKTVDIRKTENYSLSFELDEFFNHCLNEVHCKIRRFEWNYLDNVLEN